MKKVTIHSSLSYTESLINRDNIFSGPAIDEAMSWYEQCDCIGCHLAPSAQYYYNQNPKQRQEIWLEYDKIPFKKRGVFNPRVLLLFLESGAYSLQEMFSNIGPLSPDIIDKYENTVQYVRHIENLRDSHFFDKPNTETLLPNED